MHFSNPVIFDLPVLPRVQKFIRTKLTDSAGQVQPMLASPQALGPGLMLWAMAQSPKIGLHNRWHTRPERSKRPQRVLFDERLTARQGLGIYQFHPSRHQYLLNYAELEVFSNMVDHMIQNELVGFCQLAPSVPPMVRIKAFCDSYDFSEDDFTEGALKQMYLRYRKQTGAYGFAPEVSRSFQFVPLLVAA